MEENPATKIRIKIEGMAERMRKDYTELSYIYKQICAVEEKIEC